MPMSRLGYCGDALLPVVERDGAVLDLDVVDRKPRCRSLGRRTRSARSDPRCCRCRRRCAPARRAGRTSRTASNTGARRQIDAEETSTSSASNANSGVPGARWASVKSVSVAAQREGIELDLAERRLAAELLRATTIRASTSRSADGEEPERDERDGRARRGQSAHCAARRQHGGASPRSHGVHVGGLECGCGARRGRSRAPAARAVSSEARPARRPRSSASRASPRRPASTCRQSAAPEHRRDECNLVAVRVPRAKSGPPNTPRSRVSWTCSPVSSHVSRTAASAGTSSGSIMPPGVVHRLPST